jgi:hypothetical protein
MQSIYNDTIDENVERFDCLSNSIEITSISLDSILPNTFPSFRRGNTTIIPFSSNEYMLNIRNVNYLIDDNGFWHHQHPDKSIDTQNELVILDCEFNVKALYHFKTPSQYALYRGIEDIRIIFFNGMYYYCASYQNTDGKICISSSFYNLMMESLPIRIIQSPLHKRVEKNWAMFVHQNQLKYVYQWCPFQVGVITNDCLSIIYEKHYPQPFFKHIKNSSIGVEDKENGEIWFLVHFNTNTQLRQYYHCIIVLDGNTLMIKKISKCFTFERKKIEYCLGFVLEKTQLIFSYTTFDREPKLLKIPRCRIESMFISSV